RGRMDAAAESLGRAARHARDPRVAERATLAALYAKHFEEARQAAALWVELAPAATDAHESSATALLELGRLPEARAELAQVLAAERARNNLDPALLRTAALLGRVGPRDNIVNFMRELIEP